MDINYEKLSEIIVKNQSELDMIPTDFKGRIYIEFGTSWKPAIVRNRYYYSVVARGNSSVVARGNSSVEAWGNSSVVARENSSVEAWGNSSVVAWENSSVVARGNSQIVDRLSGGRIEITGNARIVYMPKKIMEYCDFYGLEHDKKSGKFFKCVHKRNGRYFANHEDSFEYIIGEKAIPDSFDTDSREDCGHGIHVAHMNWVLDFGRDWVDLAIIEVEAKLKDIIVPELGNGKIRCKEVMVLREVPLEECGVFGKILAKRNNNQ